MRIVDIPDEATLLQATDVVRRWLAVTPIVASPPLGEGVFLKLETLQPTGSFKVRGGLASVAAATVRDAGTPIIAASAGNHALGVAFAADRFGARATVVLPRTASEAKVERLSGSVVQLFRRGENYEEAEAYALTLADEVGGRFVSPYNDPHVIAGAGTIAGELSTQLPDLGTIVVPAGGGGLLSGIGLSTAKSGIRLVGVEAQSSMGLSASTAAGRVVTVPVRETLADGLAGNLEPGSITVELVRRHVSEMVAASEQEIAGAIRYLASEHGLIVEGSGAVGVAALLSGRLTEPLGRCVVLVTGRNITTSEFGRVLLNPTHPRSRSS